MKNTTKTIVAIFTAILFATATKAQVKTNTAENFTVKYTGAQEGYIYFEVTVPNNFAENVYVKVEDTKEGELFSDNFTKTKTTIKFKIEKQDKQEIRFKIISGNNVYEKLFTAHTRVLEATSVDEKVIAVL
jgi:hypothetical protein